MTRAKDISKILTDADISGNIDVDGVTNLDVTDIDGTLNVAGETTLQTHLNMGDGDIIKLGASADLTIQHDGSHSYVKDAGTGNLFLDSVAGSAIIRVNDGYNALEAIGGGAVNISHNGNTKIATASTGVNVTGGIGLGGTGTANILDDYEEGTWTPNVGGDSTYNEQVGKYIKVGNHVTLWFTLRINARNSPSAPYIVAGNPFTNNNAIGGTGVVHYFNSIQTAAVVLTTRIDINGGNINISGATGSANTTANVNHDWAGNGAAVYGFVTFFSA